MIVEVYRIARHTQLTVRCPVERRVIAYRDSVVLLAAVFAVNKRARERSLREKKKSVHAVVNGLLVGPGQGAPAGWDRVTYDPFAADTFLRQVDGAPMHYARVVYIGPEGVFVPGRWSEADRHSGGVDTAGSIPVAPMQGS